MKKFFSFVAAALVSMSLFAEPAVVPTVNDIKVNYDESHIVLCVYFDEEVCNDLVFAGSYNNWGTDPATMLYGEPLEGFEGWYVFDVATVVGDGSDEGKPVQLKNDGGFDWAYQTGDVASWIHKGGNELNLTAGYAGEANVAYPAVGIYIYESAYFKVHNTPCVTIPEHDYTIRLYAPESETCKPAIIGHFNGWSTGMEMVEDVDLETFEVYYEAKIHDEEKAEYKFKALTDTDWSNQLQHYDAAEDAWFDLGNEVLGTEEVIVLRYNSEDYRYTKECEVAAVENNTVKAAAVKTLVNGQLVLTVGEKQYNVYGAEL